MTVGNCACLRLKENDNIFGWRKNVENIITERKETIIDGFDFLSSVASEMHEDFYLGETWNSQVTQATKKCISENTKNWIQLFGKEHSCGFGNKVGFQIVCALQEEQKVHSEATSFIVEWLLCASWEKAHRFYKAFHLNIYINDCSLDERQFSKVKLVLNFYLFCFYGQMRSLCSFTFIWIFYKIFFLFSIVFCLIWTLKLILEQ